MAFTKVLGPGIHTLSNITSHNINSSGIVTAVSFVGDGSSLTGIANTDFIVGTAITMGTGNFTGNLTVGGVLTYEDVKNVDSIGVVTARNGIDCNGDLDVDGHTNLDNTTVAGITTFTNVVTKFSANNGGNTHLQILSTGSGEAGIFFDAANGDISGSDYIFIGQQNNLDFVIKANPNAGNIDFQRGTDTKVRIDTSGNLNVNYDLDVDGHTNLDNLSVAGVSTFSGNLTVDNGTSSTIRLEADSGGEALFLATGGSGAQATAAIELMQSSTSLQGGGISYNGDGSPAWASGEAADRMTYYRRANGTRHEVFSYPYSDNNVTFNGNILPELDSTTDLGANATRFSRVYADALYGKVQDTTFTSAVTIDVNGTDDGATTLLTLDNYIADIGTEYTWIDFTFRDSNANAVPQVKIGAQVQDPTGNQTQEGTGDFVVQCGVDNNTTTNTMTEMFRCSHDTKITSVHHHPQSDSNFDLGTNTVRWRNVYADTLYGDGSNLTGIDTDLVSDTSPQLGGTLDVNGQVVSFGDSNGSTTNIAKFGASDDLVIYHNGSHSKIIDMGTGNLYLESDVGSIYLRVSDNEQGVTIHQDGAVELYHNNSKKVETFANGIIVYGPEGQDGLLNLYADEGDDNADKWRLQADTNGSFYLKNYASGSWETNIATAGNGAVELYHNGSLKLDTRSSGVGIGGDLFFVDSSRIYMGSSNDFLFFHDGANSQIVNATGNIVYRSDTHHFKDKDNGDTHAKFNHDGSVELYNDNSKKLETTSSGVHVTGSLNVTTTMHIPDGSVGLQFGNSNDMIAYHNGSNSFIQHQGTGSLYIDSLNNSADIYVRSKDNLHLMTNNNAQNSVVCVGNGGVILYNAGSQKFTTNGDGIAVTGRATFPDGNSNGVVIGDSGDVRLFHNGSHTYLENDTGNFVLDNSSGVDMYINSGNDIYIRPQGTEDGIKLIGNGAVELYHNGNRQVFTIDGGMNWQDNKKAEFGNSGDLKIYHDGSNSYIKDSGTGGLLVNSSAFDVLNAADNEFMGRFIQDAQVELYHNGSKRFETTANGLRTSGELIYMGPNNITNFIHSGGNISLTADTSIFFVCDCNDTSGDAPAGEFIWGGGSNTNTDSNQDFTTAEFGNSGQPRNQYMILDESSLRPANNNNLDLGGSSNRWKTIYTMDLEQSNKGSVNSVDGTWGDWTLQEGENDIYMINNRTGKKFKIKMEAVD